MTRTFSPIAKPDRPKGKRSVAYWEYVDDVMWIVYSDHDRCRSIFRDPDDLQMSTHAVEITE
jgi:hypothetical protein